MLTPGKRIAPTERTGDMSTPWGKTKSSSSVDVDFLRLCEHIVLDTLKLAKRGTLLNARQCLDLSSKLFHTVRSIRELTSDHAASSLRFGPALQSLYRYVEKAKLLVKQCGEEDWCEASVFQGQNENSFKEILQDVSFCYNVIVDEVLGHRFVRVCPSDFPATAREVEEDEQELRKKLEGLASKPSSVKLFGYFGRERTARNQCLARYLVRRFRCTSQESQANSLDRGNAILWEKETEPSGTWGNSKFLGAGSGASGVCSDQWLGIPCAKKEFHGAASEELFLKEAGILAHLKHPCIVNFMCCGNGEERGDRFLAMELMEKSLFDVIEGRKGGYFPVPVVVDIILQIARGMHYLHGEGVAHRDLKPQNVVVNRLTYADLVDDYYCVKLVDFGMSKTKVEVSKSNTISVQGVGTTWYRAPEVHPKAHPDGKGKARWLKADVYSFAMTCAHLLFLKTPFEDMEELSELYEEQLSGRRPEICGGCPEELVAVLKDCWDTDPHSRPTFLEICTRLELLRCKIMGGVAFYNFHEQTDYNANFELSRCMARWYSSMQGYHYDDHDEVVEGEPGATGRSLLARKGSVNRRISRIFVSQPHSQYQSIPETAASAKKEQCQGSTSHQTSYFSAQDHSFSGGNVVRDGDYNDVSMAAGRDGEPGASGSSLLAWKDSRFQTGVLKEQCQSLTIDQSFYFSVQDSAFYDGNVVCDGCQKDFIHFNGLGNLRAFKIAGSVTLAISRMKLLVSRQEEWNAVSDGCQDFIHFNGLGNLRAFKIAGSVTLAISRMKLLVSRQEEWNAVSDGCQDFIHFNGLGNLRAFKIAGSVTLAISRMKLLVSRQEEWNAIAGSVTLAISRMKLLVSRQEEWNAVSDGCQDFIHFNGLGNLRAFKIAGSVTLAISRMKLLVSRQEEWNAVSDGCQDFIHFNGLGNLRAFKGEPGATGRSLLARKGSVNRRISRIFVSQPHSQYQSIPETAASVTKEQCQGSTSHQTSYFSAQDHSFS